MVPNGVRPPQDPPKATKATKADNFFSAQTVPFDLSVNPWWSLIVSGLPGTLQRPQGRKGRQFFSAQTVPFDLSVDPWWSLIVSGLPGTLQRPQGRKGHQGQNLFLAQTVSFHQSVIQ